MKLVVRAYTACSVFTEFNVFFTSVCTHKTHARIHVSERSGLRDGIKTFTRTRNVQGNNYGRTKETKSIFTVDGCRARVDVIFRSAATRLIYAETRTKRHSKTHSSTEFSRYASRAVHMTFIACAVVLLLLLLLTTTTVQSTKN